MNDLISTINSKEDFRKDLLDSNHGTLPYESPSDQMKVDVLKEHWDKISLDHIDEMVKKL